MRHDESSFGVVGKRRAVRDGMAGRMPARGARAGQAAAAHADAAPLRAASCCFVPPCAALCRFVLLRAGACRTGRGISAAGAAHRAPCAVRRSKARRGRWRTPAAPGMCCRMEAETH
ncbi:hypothetical protein BOC49_24705 [Burkholderia pseudomallei]|nr:hypothetical protein BOC49_24705 [Burkholderia pseudomallei]